MTVLSLDKPAEAVMPGVRLPITELGHGPHLLEARSLQKSLGVKRGIPFGKIPDGEVHTAIGSRIQCGRHPLLVLQLPFQQPVSCRAVRYDITFADDARCAHAEWPEDAFLQEVSVELARDLVNQNPEG